MRTHHLGILLLDTQPSRRTAFESELIELGHRIVRQTAHSSELQSALEQYQPDLVILVTDQPDKTTLSTLQTLIQSHPTPVVLFAESPQATQVAGEAIKSGVCSFVVGEINFSRLQPIMESALAHFSCYQQLRHELEQTRDQLSSRKITERAKGLLMQHHHCSEEQAFSALRKLAMDRGQKLPDVANEVIQMFRASS